MYQVWMYNAPTQTMGVVPRHKYQNRTNYQQRPPKRNELGQGSDHLYVVGMAN